MTRLAIFTTHPIQYQAPWFRALAAADGLDVEVVFSYVPDAAQQGVGFGTAFEWNIPLLTGYSHHVLSTASLPRLVPGFARRWALGVGKVLDDLRPDVAMVLGWQEISLVQALLACRRRGIPVILRGESNALRPRPGLVSMLHRRYFGLCDAFLAIGRANADLYRSAGVDESRILTAGYFVDHERFKASADNLCGERDVIRANWAIASKTTCFAFVGKLEPKKSLMDYLQAIRLTRKVSDAVSGLIVGSGIEFKQASLFVAQHRLPVTFAGFLNQSEIPSAYVASDALVLPSNHGETWGLVANEAMACGKPAIVSDRIGAAHDLVVDGRTGFVVPYGDVEALSAAMMRLTEDREACQTMGAAACAHLTEGYTIVRAVERTREAIELVLSKRNAAD